MTTDIDFGEWLPDAPDYKNPGLTVCNNVYALNIGYKPIASPSGTGEFLTGQVKGAQSFFYPDQTPFIVFGTDTDLFVLYNGVLIPSNLGLSLIKDDYWSFDQLGSSLYATCKTHGLFRLDNIFDISISVFYPITVSEIIPVPGQEIKAPPKGRYVNTIGEFLFLGNIIDTDGEDKPFWVRWSAYNNPLASWVDDTGAMSGAVRMDAIYGAVTGIYGGTFDLIFQESGVTSIQFTSGPTIFIKRVIENERGCIAPRSIVEAGGQIYFLSADGFCASDGQSVRVVSSDRVWDWFKTEISSGNEKNVIGAIDWSNRSIIWAFGAGGSNTPNRQLIYNFGLNRWTTATIGMIWPVTGYNPAFSIDDTDVNILNDDILDVDGPSFDDPQYGAMGRALMAILPNGEIAYLRGPNLQADFETGDFQIEVGQRSFISSIYPMVENDSQNALSSAAGRDNLGSAKVFGEYSAQNTLGFCPVISDARFHSVKVRMPSGTNWNKASGFQVEAKRSGIA